MNKEVGAGPLIGRRGLIGGALLGAALLAGARRIEAAPGGAARSRCDSTHSTPRSAGADCGLCRTPNLTTARKFIELMSTGKDYDTWGPMLTEDAEFLRPFAPPGLAKSTKGRTVWVNSSREAFKAIKEFRWIHLELHSTDEPDVVYGTGKSSAELADGRYYKNEYVFIVKFEDGLVKKFWEYLDPIPVMEAFGKELAGGKQPRVR